jgi:DNA-binding winged helix-turn-helix (wHTH) protein/thioredoxin-like negative regulator of GroEL
MAVLEVYEFGEFTLEVSERRLSKNGEPVSLEPKAHEVLLALIRNAGRLMTKRELLDQVWPESFVEEGILAVHVSGLRKALGQDARRCIETVSGAGYRFIGKVRQRDANGERPWLWSFGVPPAPTAVRPEVYELIGRGRSHLLKASMFEVPNAVAAFRAAIELDPGYAPAHAGLALACCAQARLRIVPPAEAYYESRSAALRALAMDDACADAQVALGEVLFLSDWNWEGAERSLKRALQLDPHHTEAYLLTGQLLEALGRLKEGLEMKLKALERDPFSALVHLQISMSYWHQRRYDGAIEWADKALDLDPQHPHAREHLAGAYWKKGDFNRYLAESIEHAKRHGVPAAAFDPFKQAHASGGRAGVFRLFLERASSQPQAFPAMQLALFYGEAGEMDRAFEHLERAIENHDPALVHLAIAPQWDSLRGDPRFNQCLERMGLSAAA